LTYKSIYDALDCLEAAKRLRRLRPWHGGKTPPREIYISDEVDDLVSRPWPKRDRKRHKQARAFLEIFCQNGYVLIANNPFDKPSNAMIARVDPVNLQVFDFRCIKPERGIRVFGCFAVKDTFVALTWDYREEIDDFAQCARECRQEWDELFQYISPLAKTDLSGYLSTNFRAV
jgi:hypothetical protein